MSGVTLNARLLAICVDGSLDDARVLVSEGADPFWQDSQGQNSLIVNFVFARDFQVVLGCQQTWPSGVGGLVSGVRSTLECS